MKKLEGSYQDTVFEDAVHIKLRKYDFLVRCVFMDDYEISAPKGYATIADCKFLKPRCLNE